MSVPESIAWLETSRDSKSPSGAKIYATTILGELQRLSEQLDLCARELEKRDGIEGSALTEYRRLEDTFHALERRTRDAREEWDARRSDLEARLTKIEEKLGLAENTLKDVHYALIKQPELTREEIAGVITSVVTPYGEGERP